VVDIRPAATYAEGFIPGTISIPLTRSFVSYAGWLIDTTQEVFLVTGDSGDASARRALSELSMIGVDRIGGWFGADALADARTRQAVDSFSQIRPTELTAALRRDNAQLVDVRARDEWESGHIPGSLHIPLGHIEQRVDELDPARPVVLTCQTGSRSSIAASLLKAQGFRDVANLRGGFSAWSAAELPAGHGGIVGAHG
jgi:hydroxyacylglutathione hydrolase